MISLFRKIRQTLLGQNKITRYLAYSFGEIFLVVVGILLALAINNWNTRRTERNLERIYLEGLVRDLKTQLQEVDTHEKRELTYVVSSKNLIENFNATGKFSVDFEFTKEIGNLVNRRTFVKSDPTFEELITTGNLDIIQDNVLKDEIIQYYQFLSRVESILQSNNSNFVDDKFRNGVYALSKFSMIETIRAALSPDNLNDDNTLIAGLVETNSPALLKITEENINDPKNVLWFSNLLQFRNTQATIHAFYMRQVRQRTQSLLEKIEVKNI